MDVSSFYESLGEDAPKPRPIPYGGRPKYIKLAPGDEGDNLPDVFFEDPRTFVPKPGPKGQIHAWGLYPYEYEEPDPKAIRLTNLPAFDGVRAMLRQMKYQMIYFGSDKSPDSQFLKVILERKRKQLAATKLGSLAKSDVILKVSIAFMTDSKGQPRVWRRIRVSAGIKLSVFQDKVLAPILGWVRNLHCYTFTDYRDGSLYGPEHASSVDVAHIAQVGYDYLPDDQYMLAHLFAKEGDVIGYLYDFGDKWFHEIEVERIIPAEVSDGSIKIISGKGMCPGENMNGSFQYDEFLKEFDTASPTERHNKKREILASPNYKDFGKPPSLFDPAVFDMSAATDRLTAALSSTNSVRSGAKKFNIPMGGEEVASIREQMAQKDLKKGQSITKDFEPDSPGYWEETTSNVKDRRRETVCAACGKPGDRLLKTCSGCRQIFYCSTEHQKNHWKSVHKAQCTRKYLSKKQ